MMKKNRVTSITVSLAIVIGLLINSLLEKHTNIPTPVNWIIVFFLSSTIHGFMYWLLSKMINHFELLLKIYWGKTYIKGYWSYSYIVDGEKKYGAWCIDQDVDGIRVKGFGLTKEGVRRSDVQSLTSLIERGNDYEIVNMRRDISNDGVLSDAFYYSKTSLHMQQRDTFMNLFNYPLRMDGTTYVYGGEFSGTIHTQLEFKKHTDAKNEHDIEDIVKDLIV